MPLRVAPLRTVLLFGLDETNVELARGLRRLGLRVLLAQQAGVRRREVFLDLHDGGYPVFAVEDAEELSGALRSHGAPDLAVLGFSSDTRLTPEGEVQEGDELDAADAELAADMGPDGPVAFDRVSGELYDRHADELERLLAARMMQFVPDADVPGRATAPIEVGSLRGTRYRLGSERVPSRERMVQVDLYRRDDASEEIWAFWSGDLPTGSSPSTARRTSEL
jgi:hypothetical protein